MKDLNDPAGFAGLMARVDGATRPGSRKAVLDAYGIDEARLARLQRDWKVRIRREGQATYGAYRQGYRAALREIAASAPATAIAAAAQPSAAAPAVAVPSYLLPQQQAASPIAPAQAGTYAVVPVVNRAPAHLAGTALVDNAVLARPATPFVPGTFEPPAPAAASARKDARFSGTVAVDNAAFVGNPTTPFQPTIEAASPPPPAPPQASPSRSPSPLAGTAFLSDDLARAVRSAKPLPFDERPAQPPPRREPPAASGVGTGTVLDQAGAPGMGGPALPFASSTSGLPPLKEYVRITAMLQKEGNSPATYARLGINPAAWAATARDYAAKLASDPMLAGLFQQLMRRALTEATGAR